MVGAVDPDTPQDVSKYPKLNTATGLTEHRPYGQQYNYEMFVGGQDQLPNAAAALCVVYVPQYFRVVRNQAAQVKAELFIEAARTLGAGPLWI